MHSIYSILCNTDTTFLPAVCETYGSCMERMYNMPLISTATSYAKKVLLFCYNKGGFLLLYLDVLLK
jgi:hypothetical protein